MKKVEKFLQASAHEGRVADGKLSVAFAAFKKNRSLHPNQAILFETKKGNWHWLEFNYDGDVDSIDNGRHVPSNIVYEVSNFVDEQEEMKDEDRDWGLDHAIVTKFSASTWKELVDLIAKKKKKFTHMISSLKKVK